jgi:hypothetical protein
VHIGLLYVPELAGAVLMAVALGLVINTRYLQVLPVFGMVMLAVGIILFRIEVPSSQAMTLVASFFTGLGLGATVAPALFGAGFSLPATDLQRVFAIVELFRAVAAFMIAPIFAHFAVNYTGGLVKGTGWALWIGLAVAVIGTLVALSFYVLGGARINKPDLDGFLSGRNAGYPSPPLLARLRGINPLPAGAASEGAE